MFCSPNSFAGDVVQRQKIVSTSWSSLVTNMQVWQETLVGAEGMMTKQTASSKWLAS